MVLITVKKKRSAKQIAATKKLVALNKRKSKGKSPKRKKKATKTTRGSGKTAKKGKRKGGPKVKNIGIATVGVGINAAFQLGMVDAVDSFIQGGSVKDSLGIVRDASGDFSNLMSAATPVILLGFAKKFVGKIPLFKLGKWQFNLL